MPHGFLRHGADSKPGRPQAGHREVADVSYDRVGTGMDYLNVIEQAPLTLHPGATLATVRFSVPVDAG